MPKYFYLLIIAILASCEFKKEIPNYPLALPPLLIEEHPEIARKFYPKGKLVPVKETTQKKD